MVAKQTLPSEFVVRLELNRLGQQRARVLLQLALSLFRENDEQIFKDY